MPNRCGKRSENAADVADRVRFIHSRAFGLAVALSQLDVEAANGLLADLGVSRYQLTDPERGFSLMSRRPSRYANGSHGGYDGSGSGELLPRNGIWRI